MLHRLPHHPHNTRLSPLSSLDLINCPVTPQSIHNTTFKIVDAMLMTSPNELISNPEQHNESYRTIDNSLLSFSPFPSFRSISLLVHFIKTVHIVQTRVRSRKHPPNSSPPPSPPFIVSRSTGIWPRFVCGGHTVLVSPLSTISSKQPERVDRFLDRYLFTA